MLLVKLIALFSVLSSATRLESIGGDDASRHCLSKTAFCERTREWKLD